MRKTNNLPLSRVSARDAGGTKRSPKLWDCFAPMHNPTQVLAIDVWLFCVRSVNPTPDFFVTRLCKIIPLRFSNDLSLFHFGKCSTHKLLFPVYAHRVFLLLSEELFSSFLYLSNQPRLLLRHRAAG